MNASRLESVAYVTTYDSTRPGSWSGIGYCMPAFFIAEGVRVERIGPLAPVRRPDVRLRSGLTKALTGKRYLTNRSPAVLAGYARQTASRLATLDVDAVLSPGTIPIAYLETDVPVVFWTDATFDALVNFYPEYSRLSPQSLQDGHRMEQAALDRCSLAIYSSPWAAETAKELYDVRDEKMAVVPFGPSLGIAPDPGRIDGIIVRRFRRPLKLVFIGTDWARKGGDVALSITAGLLRAGIDVELHIVGVRLPGPIPGVVDHGYISQGTEEGVKRFASLLEDANFLLLPTRADALPVALAEACSFALPFLTTDVGGTASVFTDGVEGRIFERDAPPDAYIDVIRELLQEPAEYDALCRRARGAYDSRINWPHAVREARALMEEAIEG